MTVRSIFLHVLAIAIVVALGAGLDVMEVDAAQYAGMARDMMVNGDLLELKYRGGDYLDKPPLLFWLTALSFKLFGVGNVAYRLPSILFAFLGLYATYRFARLYYGRELGLTAMFMFGGSVAFFLMCNDVRCDTILTGAVITAIWLGCAWCEQGRWWQLFGAAVAVSAGLLAKGPIGAVVPLLAIGAQVVCTRRWNRLRDPRLLLALALVGLLLLPMCIGLYHQHGWHGVRFYFWEQSFGRITGENRWKDDSTVLFFTHELLWQLLPWTVLLLVGIWNSLKALVQRTALLEYASIVGAVLAFVALSLSQFKLPHYLYVTLPLFAVLAARGLHSAGRVLWRVHQLLLVLLCCGLVLLSWSVFPAARWPFTALALTSGLVAAMFYRRYGLHGGAFHASFWLMIAAGVLLNGQFYPNLLRYQANAKAGQWAARHQLDQNQFFGMQVSGGAMDFYAGHPVRWLSDAREAQVVIASGVAIYTDEAHRAELLAAGLVPKTEVRFWNFPAQRLSLPFLLPAQRPALLEARYVMRF